MKQRLITLMLACCLCLQAAAQHSQEVSVNAGGGLSTLLFSYGNSNQKLGAGGKVGLGYTYFLSPEWGLATGVDFGFYNTKSTLERDVQSQAAVDAYGDRSFTFTATYTNYEEKASAVLLTIPLMAQYQTGNDKAFYVAFGVKVGFPISAKFKSSGNLSTKGYYPDNNITYYGDTPEKGFADYSGETTTKFKLNPSLMLAVELGAKWKVLDKYTLYTGAYCDYGFTDMNNTDSNGVLVTYQPQNPSEFKRGSLVGSSDRITSLALGVTLRLSLPL